MPSYKPHIELLESAFLDLIRSVPTITDVSIPNSTARSAVADYVDVDGIAELHGFEPRLTTPSKEQWILIVQTRVSGDPRLVRESCMRLKEEIKKTEQRETLPGSGSHLYQQACSGDLPRNECWLSGPVW